MLQPNDQPPGETDRAFQNVEGINPWLLRDTP
jgi:hypothetical protein